MFRWLHRVSPLPAGLPGLVLAMWALVSQVAAGSFMLPGDMAAGQRAIAHLDALSILCSPDHAPGQPHPAVPHHHADSALCPLQVVAASGVILTSAPAAPLPGLGGPGLAAVLPPARAPPAPPHTTALPRGPPAFA